MRRLILLGVILLGSTPPSIAQDSNKTSLEDQLLSEIRAGKQSFKAIRMKALAQSVEKRRRQRFRVGQRYIEFEFHGDYPAGFCLPSSIEYILAPAGTKDHETLLALSKKEWSRAKALGAALQGYRKKGRAPRFELDLLWLEQGKVRKESLGDIVSLASAKAQGQFFSSLKFSRYGLAGRHIKGDSARLPLKKGPLQIRIRLYLN